ncbi:MAG: guanylate kinase [Kiritimatiellia bacterium]|nr:guanylate kinase [Kiritimatiellia bacterium]
MINPKDKPLLMVVSAPSGAGKTTLCNLLLNEFQNMTRSISCTTREKRQGEVHGRDYYFITLPEFAKCRRRDKFLESASVHSHRYATPRLPVLSALAEGRDVLLVIDVQGAKMIRNSIKKGADNNLKAAFVDVFIVPPSMKELKRRLLKRGKDRPAEISIRLKNAAGEMKAWRDFRYVVVNDRLEQAYKRLRSIVIAEHCRNVYASK